jgi:hypothetical protein
MDEQTEDGEQEGHRQKLGRAEDAQLGGERFDQRQRGSGDDEFGEQRGDGDEHRGAAVSAVGGDSPGNEEGKADACVVEELEARCPFDQREVARRILEQHRFVDHGEFEMGGRIVDWDAGVLGEQHHDEGDGREDYAGVDDASVG